MPEGLWMPVYSYEENKFIVIGNRVYDTREEAIANAVGDGFELMCKDNIVALTTEAYCIPFTEEEAKPMLSCKFVDDMEVAVFAGPLYDKEIKDEWGD